MSVDTKTIQWKLWKTAISQAIIFFIILLGYAYIYNNELSLLCVSQAVAGTAGFMIGISLALGSLAYFKRSLGPKVANRKYIGLVGFWLALTYTLMLLWLDPDRYFFGFFGTISAADGFFGLTAIIILSFMALISNNWGIRKLGVKNWRIVLRLGYVAYFLLVLRAIALEWEIWSAWWSMPLFELPPPRLVVSIFAILVILLRIAVSISKQIKMATRT